MPIFKGTLEEKDPRRFFIMTTLVNILELDGFYAIKQKLRLIIIFEKKRNAPC